MYQTMQAGSEYPEWMQDIAVPQVTPKLGSTPYFIPIHSVQMLPATPDGSLGPNYPAPERNFLGTAIEWANKNSQAVMIASGVLVVMAMFGGKKRR